MELKRPSEKFILDWFGCEGRELGCPERFFTSNPSESLEKGIRPCIQEALQQPLEGAGGHLMRLQWFTNILRRLQR